jgi:hypothetical protein
LSVKKQFRGKCAESICERKKCKIKGDEEILGWWKKREPLKVNKKPCNLKTVANDSHCSSITSNLEDGVFVSKNIKCIGSNYENAPKTFRGKCAHKVCSGKSESKCKFDGPEGLLDWNIPSDTNDWIGEYFNKSGDNLEIFEKENGKLYLKGFASNDMGNTAEVEGELITRGDVGKFSNDCKITLKRLVAKLEVVDDGECGGIGVTFKGAFKLKP